MLPTVSNVSVFAVAFAGWNCTTNPAMKVGVTICSATQTVVPWSVLPARVTYMNEGSEQFDDGSGEEVWRCDRWHHPCIGSKVLFTTPVCVHPMRCMPSTLAISRFVILRVYRPYGGGLKLCGDAPAPRTGQQRWKGHARSPMFVRSHLALQGAPMRC